MKYELTDETIMFNHHKLYRIRALRSFGDGKFRSSVRKGDLGGWVGSEYCLSQEGDCWVYHNAKVFPGASVSGNAKIYDNAEIYDDAIVSGDAEVHGNSKVYSDAVVDGNAEIYGMVRVHGGAKVYGDAKLHGDASIARNADISNADGIFRAQYIGPDKLSLTVYRTTDGVAVELDNAFYRVEDFRDKVETLNECAKLLDSVFNRMVKDVPINTENS